MTPREQAERARSLAAECGFDLAGIADAAPPPEVSFLAGWLARGHAGEMSWLVAQAERRSDLRRAIPWARSVLCLGLQYDTPGPYSVSADPGRGWVSRYAWGDDYHDVLGGMLTRLGARLEAELGPLRWSPLVDTGPLVERAYAAAAGLGAWGRNTCLLHPEHGSWFFLGEIVLDRELPPDAPRPDLCGTCTACLDACPTGALVAPHDLDSRRCLSYLTIELKGSIPEELRPGLGRNVFGCDVCQDVCPWNRRRRRRGGEAFEPRPGLQSPDLDDLASLDAAGFSSRFRRSPIKRAKRRGLLRSVAVALGNLGDASKRPVLERLAGDEEPLAREHAQWALAHLGEAPDPQAR